MSQVPHILPNIPKFTADARPGALPYEPVCAVFRRYLHQTKLKFTPERAMILDAVLRKEGLFEPEGLIDHLKSLNHRVSRATVYRTLSHLQDAGILKQVFFDNRPVLLRGDRRAADARLPDLRRHGEGDRVQ